MHFRNPLTLRQMLSQILRPAFECGMSIFHSLIGLITIEEPLWEIMRNRRKKGCCMPFPPPESFLSVAQLTSHDLKSFKMWTLSTIRTSLNVYHPSFINKENQFLPTTNEFSCSARMGEGESNAVAGSLLNTLHQSSLRGREVTYMPFGKVKTKAHRIPTSLRERLLQRPWAQEAGVPLKLCPGGSGAGSGRATAMLICFVTSLWYVQRVRHQYSPCEKKAHPSLWKLYLSKSNKSSHRHERPRSRGNMKIQHGTASDHFGIGRFFFFFNAAQPELKHLNLWGLNTRLQSTS